MSKKNSTYDKIKNHITDISKTIRVKSLVFLLLITTAIIASQTISKYSSTAVLTTSTKVAAFMVGAYVEQGQNNSLEINCRDYTKYTASYKFSVTNKENSKISEVSAKYHVEIKLLEKLPDGVVIKIDNKNVKTKSSDGLTYTFTDIGTFNQGQEKVNTHELTFIAEPKVISEDIQIDKIKIGIIVEQID